MKRERAINVSLICAQVYAMFTYISHRTCKERCQGCWVLQSQFINSRRLSCRNCGEWVSEQATSFCAQIVERLILFLLLFANCTPDVRFAPRLLSLHLSAYNFSFPHSKHGARAQTTSAFSTFFQPPFVCVEILIFISCSRQNLNENISPFLLAAAESVLLAVSRVSSYLLDFESKRLNYDFD